MGIVEIVLRCTAACPGNQAAASQIGGAACPGLFSDDIAAVQIETGNGSSHSLCRADSLCVIGIGAALAVYRLAGQLVEAVVAVARNCRNSVLMPPLAFRLQIPVGIIGGGGVFCLPSADVLTGSHYVGDVIDPGPQSTYHRRLFLSASTLLLIPFSPA